MSARVLSKVIGGACAAVPVVYGKDNSEKKSTMVKPSQLPIYQDPTESLEFEIEYKPTNALEENISIVRKMLWSNAAKVESTRLRVVQFYETGVAHSQNMYAYLTDDAHMLPRAVAITVGGLAGLLTAARGGPVKKVTYSGIGMLGVASLCYPKQTVKITRHSYELVKEKGIAAVTDVTERATNWMKSTLGISKKLDAVTPMEKVADEVSDVQYYGFRLIQPNDVKPSAEKGESKPSIQVEGDIGQSNPEDKDMYTTRQ